MVDVGKDPQVTEALEEGIHKMMDRGCGVEHTEVSIIHPGDMAKCGRTSIQRLSVHW